MDTILSLTLQPRQAALAGGLPKSGEPQKTWRGGRSAASLDLLGRDDVVHYLGGNIGYLYGSGLDDDLFAGLRSASGPALSTPRPPTTCRSTATPARAWSRRRSGTGSSSDREVNPEPPAPPSGAPRWIALRPWPQRDVAMTVARKARAPEGALVLARVESQPSTTLSLRSSAVPAVKATLARETIRVGAKVAPALPSMSTRTCTFPPLSVKDR